MKRLSFIELIALLFTGIAGLASGVQAYVSWEMRGEVSRAIVFAQRIDACSQAMAAIEPFVAKARPEGRAVLAGATSERRYSLPQYYYRRSAGNAAFKAEHNPRVEQWRVASAALLIVGSEGTKEQVQFFDRIITKEIPQGQFMSRSELMTWLEQVEIKSLEMTDSCRALT